MRNFPRIPLTWTAWAMMVGLPASADSLPADVAQMLQTLQERVTRLEARNAELERHLAESARPAAKDEALAARVEDVENAVLALRDKPSGLERLEGISAGASLTLVAQRADGGAARDSQLTVRADVEVELAAGSIGDAEGKLFAHFRAGEGDGVAPASFATPNATGGFGTSRPTLMQAWYQLDIPVGGNSGELGRMEVTVGKMDPFVFFDANNVADDESEGFLNLAFVHNPLLDAGGDIGVGSDGASPGLRLAYVSDINGGNHITASLGIYGAGRGGDYTDTFGNPFTIAQLEYAGKTWGGLEGTYRLYAWNNARALDQVNLVEDNDAAGGNDDGTCDANEECVPGIEESHRGWGLSIDQQVTENATLFARYGHSTRGSLAFDRAFTLGGQLGGSGWGRENDRLGLALGLLKSSNEYRLANPTFSGTEKTAELFYVWQANEHFHLAPSLQWIGRPGADPAAKDVTVMGLRAKLSY